MLLRNTNLEYIKLNRVSSRQPHKKRLQKFKEFFEDIKGTVKALKEFAIYENMENDRTTIVLTFLENKENMENYYSKDNKILSDLVESQTNV